jgi:hypothetical protein
MRVSAEQGGIEFLRCHLASQAFAAALIDERVTKIQLLIYDLMKLDGKQVALGLILLRHYIALPKFRFALRTCPTELIKQAIARFDCILRETTSELLGVQLTEDQFDQAALLIRYGGLGLSRAIDVAAKHYRVRVVSKKYRFQYKSMRTGLTLLTSYFSF